MSEKSLRIHPDWIQEVRAAYKSRYFNQNKLAEEADISSVDTISKFLNGKPISRANFWRLCGLLELEREQVIRAIENSLNDLGKSANTSNNTENSDFMGRDDDIAYIHHLTTQGNNCILILGGLGIGKTALARNYFKQAFSSYIEFSIAKERQNIAPVTRLIEEKLRQLNEEPSTEFLISLDRLKRKLQNERIGILIDNLETALDDNGMFVEEHRNYVELLHVLTDKSLRSITLITSRQSLSEGLDIQNLILSGLDFTVWTNFFAQQDVRADRSILDKVHKSFGGNALAMKIVCMLIKTYYQGDLGEYWRECKLESDISVEQAVRNLIRQQVAYPKVSANGTNITPEIVSNIVSTSFDLLGRDADRAELEKSSKQHKIVLLKAAAGIGKSTLAQEFLRTYFTKVIEINMALSPDDNAPASERLPIILKEFGEDASNNFGLNLEILKRRLSDKSQPSVAFLIDNIEPALGSDLKFLEKLRDYEGLLQVLGDRDVCSFTLITSRRSLIAQRVKVHEYLLQGLDIEAWREYFHDCENGATSEDLEQMCVAYNGNAKVMDILHGAIINRFDGDIAAYWCRYKDALLADTELKTLISMEMDWLRDNQPDAYKLLCRMGCYRYQDVKTVPFEGLIYLLWDILESQQVGVVDYLSKSSLIEVKEEYYLHPAVRESAKSRLLENDKDWKIANHKAAKFWDSLIKVIEKIDDALIAFESYHHYHAIKEFTLMGETLNFARDNQWEQNEFLGYSLWRLGLIDLVIGSVECCLNEIYDSTILVDLYNLLGDSYWIKGILNLAIECHEKSYQISTFAIQSNKGKDLFPFKRRRISSLINKGLCLLSKWEIDDAIKLFFAARKLCNSSPEKLKISYLFVSSFCIAFASSHSNTWQKISYKYIEKSINSLNALTNVYLNSWSRGYSLLFVATSYKSLKEIDLSHKFFLRTLDYAIESNYPQLRGLAITGLGELAALVPPYG